MTKAEFVNDPLGHYYRAKPSSSETIPSEWVREAWVSNASFRDDATAALANSVYKQGTLSFAGEWLGHLAPALSAEQAVSLYEAIRDGVDRSEMEWRPGFEQVFPQSAGALPPLDRDRTGRYLALTLFFTMAGGDANEVEKTISDFATAGVSLNDVRLPVIEIMEVANFKCFDASADDDRWSALQVAEAEGMVEIAALLREAGAV